LAKAQTKRKRAVKSVRERSGEYVGFRSPAALKEKLEKAAASANRSLSSEAQFRLERSFNEESTIDALLGGRETRQVALAVAVALSRHHDWRTNSDSYDRALVEIIEGLWNERLSRTMEGDAAAFRELVENLRARIATYWANEGSLKFEGWKPLFK
jgi:hypothetical protein